MLGPYRDSVPLEADPLPDACVPERDPRQRCPYEPRASGLGLASRFLTRAVSASATLLLLVASASLSAITWTVTENLVATRRLREEAVKMRALSPNLGTGPVCEAPKAAALTAPDDVETHDVDALWARAKHASRVNGTPTLARASLSPAAFAGVTAPVHVAFEAGPSGLGGLRVLDVADGSQAALLGLRSGDRITSVDGYGLRRPDDALVAYAHLAQGKSALVELERDGRAIVLRVDALPELPGGSLPPTPGGS
jgi:hypothetical protein